MQENISVQKNVPCGDYMWKCVYTLMFMKKEWHDTCVSSSFIKSDAQTTGTKLPNFYTGINEHTKYTQPPPPMWAHSTPPTPPPKPTGAEHKSFVPLSHTLHSPVSKGKMGIKKATMEMAFVHPWQKDPSPSASREHSYSIYRRGRERVPCHWKFSIHQWTQMTSWYQDPEESMNNWKNQRGGSENEHHTSQLLELHSQLQIRAVSSMQSNLPSLLNQGGAQSSMKLFPPLLQCCFPTFP